MAFEENSPLTEITDAEIEHLVNDHVRERQKIEYKVTMNYSEDEDRIEFLNDVVSMVNSNGGYIIVGIRDDGSGRAQQFEPEEVGDVGRIMRSTKQLCHDHISTRIDGLEFQTRNIQGNPILIIRIPKSENKPHMVTYNNNTKFSKRYHDGKREMTHDEIKNAFHGDYTIRKIDEIETHIGTIMEKLSNLQIEAREPMEGEIIDLLTFRDGRRLLARAYDKFLGEVDGKPYLWLAVCPVKPHRRLLDVDSDEIHDLIRHAPGSRDTGWSMNMSYFFPETIGEGIGIGNKDYEYIKLYKNGLLEFWTPLNSHFCWRQDPEEFKTRPRLYPYPVVEYPVTFLRLYKALVERMVYDESFILSQYYINAKNYALLPYRPGILAFDFADIDDANVNEDENIIIRNYEIEHNFNPEQVAFQILRQFYGNFGFSPDKIPFYNSEEDKFMF